MIELRDGPDGTVDLIIGPGRLVNGITLASGRVRVIGRAGDDVEGVASQAVEGAADDAPERDGLDEDEIALGY